VLTRCKRIPGVDEVVCAIPDKAAGNEILLSNARKYAKVYGGPEHDVLRRYLIVAEKISADIVMRITADCPLLSPELCGEVLAALKREGADYASNIQPRTFPKGFDCEAFTMDTLRLADREDEEREHVTTWMRHSDIRRVNVTSPWQMDGRLTLDTEDDYRVICAVFGHEAYQRL
jgi:spore coat polysaccharide biosynthesis protein SpsF